MPYDPDADRLAEGRRAAGESGVGNIRWAQGLAEAFGSGMAAAAAVFDLLPAGAGVVAPTDCYPGVHALLEDGQQQGRWHFDLVDVTGTAVAAARQADLVWLESPTNPLLGSALAQSGA